MHLSVASTRVVLVLSSDANSGDVNQGQVLNVVTFCVVRLCPLKSLSTGAYGSSHLEVVRTKL